MAKKAKKKDIASLMEREVRQSYLPQQLASLVGEICAIDVQALFRQTEDGIQDAKDENGYESMDQIAAVQMKQQKRKENLERKLRFIKALINKGGLK